MILEIVGRPEDVERYKKLRQVTVNDIDPSTGHRVVYGGLKKFGAKDAEAMENNPWVKYGPEYRMAQGTIKTHQARGKLYSPDERMDIGGLANANIIDRADERLNPAGLDATNFLKNRVLLLDHMYMSRAVVGKVVDLRPEADGVHFTATVGDPSLVGGVQNLTDAQRETRALIAQGLLQTVSVGFIPKKIRAPLFNDDGEMEEPAVIEAWELLELSIVAVPANPGAVFEAKALANSFNSIAGEDAKGLTTDVGGDKTIGTSKAKAEGKEIQTLIFPKDKYTLDEATEWAKERGYKVGQVEDLTDEYRLEQRDPAQFDQDTFQTISLSDGVEAVDGTLKEEYKEMTEEQAKELVDGITALTAEIRDGMKGLSEQNEKMMGLVAESKGGKPKEEEEDEEKKAFDERLKKVEESIEAMGETLKQQDAVIGKVYELVNA